MLDQLLEAHLLQEPIAPPALPFQRSAAPASPDDDTETHYGLAYTDEGDDTGYLTGELALTSDLLDDLGEDPDE